MMKGIQGVRRRIGGDKERSEQWEGEGGFKENGKSFNHQRHNLVIS